MALATGRPTALATLYRVEGSAPRGPGAQMLFDGERASGYFSGDCIEAEIAHHAGEVLADGEPRHLHYGPGSPWIDIHLRCGGTLYILLERLAGDCAAAHALLEHARSRRPCRYLSDGRNREVREDSHHPLMSFSEEPLRIARRFDPPRRLIVSGADPAALALVTLGAEARFETFLVRPGGPTSQPPIAEVHYLREEPAIALARIGVDRWTAFVGATHEDHHDLGACLQALRHGAGYVGMIGARARTPGRLAALEASGATGEELSRLHLSPGIVGLGKAPWEVAVGIIAEVMQALNPAKPQP